ncbi:zinc-ribbon domain-containing protein [Pelagibacterales bacterium SAG-MED50]|nr:zinc-ribbon domain-containing protein [Pelagibacterales bacterium SAG-MED50]
MIITCPNCKKKFNIDLTLIPEDGRDLKCGSCDHVWFYKVEDENSKPLTLNENNDNNEIKPNEVEIESDDEAKKKQPLSKKIIEKEEVKNTKKFLEKKKTISKDKSKNTGGKFFSYLIVFIITFVALIILLDTLKTPLINVFPAIEIILFNLFETLQDIKLFIIDLI